MSEDRANKHFQSNREMWNRLVEIHVKSDFYENEEFKKGKCTLDPLEIEEIGDVRGKSLLHLQCHFGQDTLSWARRGASVVGVDFSDDAIRTATALAEELKIPARFMLSDIASLTEQLTGEFDIVFTSGGVLCWLPELAVWGKTIARFLKPAGIFYLREFHPVAHSLDDREGATSPTLLYSYFNSDEPLRFDNTGSYADTKDKGTSVSYEWSHSLGEIVMSLIDAGLVIRQFHEYPFTTYQSHPYLVKCEDGRWRHPDKPNDFPLMFSLVAVKP